MTFNDEVSSALIPISFTTVLPCFQGNRNSAYGRYWRQTHEVDVDDVDEGAVQDDDDGDVDDMIDDKNASSFERRTPRYSSRIPLKSFRRSILRALRTNLTSPAMNRITRVGSKMNSVILRNLSKVSLAWLYLL